MKFRSRTEVIFLFVLFMKTRPNNLRKENGLKKFIQDAQTDLVYFTQVPPLKQIRSVAL